MNCKVQTGDCTVEKPDKALASKVSLANVGQTPTDQAWIPKKRATSPLQGHGRNYQKTQRKNVLLIKQGWEDTFFQNINVIKHKGKGFGLKSSDN
jgi:hypothetical protein